jgi:hypothetical protein
MRRFSGVLILVLLLVALAFAQVQVATVTSTSPFQLRGASVTPSQGVPSWPVMPGDKIKAGSAPVTVTFPDGSTITLAPGSEIKVTQSGATPVVTLLSGSASYTLKTLASVGLVADGAVTPTSLTGVLTLGPHHSSGCRSWCNCRPGLWNCPGNQWRDSRQPQPVRKILIEKS